ncbi:hypothetical protein C3432_14185 [Citrobacter amalonaticus]|uniref:OmpR/PhoB-type domain-containing protein n=1 Tax=Citrobacter amalonaticus TaxID=35703 RepID=A0A2S4RW87_CITAM|nr:winged helix-turn-helix domain-containing protein [Citrobacter amalonaticus]POT56558.1 hypothetical protein C3432_14185 [Citrobacter amalonaticus]POT75083.1 hypothetical protein C3436_14655 [Citrobacter amalonaticus]POU64612.1 hypothetical protein C3430_15675 [Citrobacter amalonaticus]POV04448.1 hypothetical protein C3424_14995 [Citrobacter amalonaticus]
MHRVSDLLTHTQLYTINNLVYFHPGKRTLKNKISGRNTLLQSPASFILHYLIINNGVVISQGKLMEVGWGDKNNITSINTLYQTVLMLRNALAEVGLSRDLIKTIARRGIMLFADISGAENTEPMTADAEVTITEEIPDPGVNTITKKPLRVTLLSIFFSLSLFFITVGAIFSLYYLTPQSLFSSYTVVDNTSFSSCTLLLKENSTVDMRYIQFMQRHMEICHDNNYVFLSGMKSAKNVAAMACQGDIRKERDTECTAWYSINDEN